MPLAKWLSVIRAFLRVPTYLLMIMYCLLGYCLAAGAGGGANQLYDHGATLVLAVLAIGAWYINATAVNDAADLQIDRDNLPGDHDRPLVVGTASRRQVVVVATGAAAAAFVLALPLGAAAAALMATMLVFNAAYSLRPVCLSWRGGLALALLPLGYVGLTTSLGYLATGAQPDLSLGMVLALCYVQFLARISLKDYRDVIGDRRHGKRTFLVRHGSSRVVALALTCHVIAATSGALWLYRYAAPAALGFACLAAAAGVFLVNLGRAPDWPHQRPWISSYGRLVSGQVALLMVGGLIRAGAITGPGLGSALLAILITGTFLWSARNVVRHLDAMVYE